MSNLAFDLKNELSTIVNNPAGHLSSSVENKTFTVASASGAQNVFSASSGPIGLQTPSVVGNGYTFTGTADVSQIVLTSDGIYQSLSNIQYSTVGDDVDSTSFSVGVNGHVVNNSTVIGYTGTVSLNSIFVGSADDVVTFNAYNSEAANATVASTTTFTLVKLS